MLSLRGVAIGYEKKVLATEISFDVETGAVLQLEGPNGAGKSTLGRVLLGELKPLCGERHSTFLQMAYVPQKSTVDTRYPISLAELIAFGFSDRWRPLSWGKAKRERKKRVDELLEKTGLAAVGSLAVADASGGQLQRALIARALASDPDFILLDEPFSNLDRQGRTDIALVLAEQRKKSCALFIVDHRSESFSTDTRRLLLENGSLKLL